MRRVLLLTKFVSQSVNFTRELMHAIIVSWESVNSSKLSKSETYSPLRVKADGLNTSLN